MARFIVDIKNHPEGDFEGERVLLSGFAKAGELLYKVYAVEDELDKVTDEVKTDLIKPVMAQLVEFFNNILELTQDGKEIEGAVKCPCCVGRKGHFAKNPTTLYTIKFNVAKDLLTNQH